MQGLIMNFPLIVKFIMWIIKFWRVYLKKSASYRSKHHKEKEKKLVQSIIRYNIPYCPYLYSIHILILSWHSDSLPDIHFAKWNEQILNETNSIMSQYIWPLWLLRNLHLCYATSFISSVIATSAKNIKFATLWNQCNLVVSDVFFYLFWK